MSFQIINKKSEILKEKKELINEFYDPKNNRYILGINEFSNKLLKYVEEIDLPIKGIIEDYTDLKLYKGIPIVKMNNVEDKNAIVISCIIDGRITTAIQNLENQGISNILSYLELSLIEEKLNDIHFCEDNIYDIEKNEDKYNWLYEVLDDKKSKETLEHIIDFRYNFNIEAMRNFKFNLHNQYFDDLVRFEDNEVFVDCGGFDGKTTEQFIKLNPKYKKAFYFEPVDKHFEESISRLKSYENIIFFKNGTYNDNIELRFSVNDSDSSISETGEDIITVVKLDDVIKEEVTYIKMDVEGAEFDSLIGAEKLIRKYKPKLAICVYHNQKDFWRIPELVLSYNSSYKVYLRHYTEGLFETVMYFL